MLLYFRSLGGLAMLSVIYVAGGYIIYRQEQEHVQLIKCKGPFNRNMYTRSCVRIPLIGTHVDLELGSL